MLYVRRRADIASSVKASSVMLLLAAHKFASWAYHSSPIDLIRVKNGWTATHIPPKKPQMRA